MFTINPFEDLSAYVSSDVMQGYVIVMILLVVGGTLFDVMHKGSAKYFFQQQNRANTQGSRKVGSGEKVSIAVQTTVVDVLTSGEFCNPRRRVAHLLGMYGFVLNLLMTIILVFGYVGPDATAPGWIVALWYAGAAMVCVGGYWFWFFIRVDVYSEGHSVFRLVRADLFILSLLGSMTSALIWAILQATDGGFATVIFLGLYLIATTVLFASVPWSKFSHMFFKPAAAYQKRVEIATGSRRNLPPPADSPVKFRGSNRMPNNY